MKTMGEIRLSCTFNRDLQRFDKGEWLYKVICRAVCGVCVGMGGGCASAADFGFRAVCYLQGGVGNKIL